MKIPSLRAPPRTSSIQHPKAKKLKQDTKSLVSCTRFSYSTMEDNDIPIFVFDHDSYRRAASDQIRTIDRGTWVRFLTDDRSLFLRNELYNAIGFKETSKDVKYGYFLREVRAIYSSAVTRPDLLEELLGKSFPLLRALADNISSPTLSHEHIISILRESPVELFNDKDIKFSLLGGASKRHDVDLVHIVSRFASYTREEIYRAGLAFSSMNVCDLVMKDFGTERVLSERFEYDGHTLLPLNQICLADYTEEWNNLYPGSGNTRLYLVCKNTIYDPERLLETDGSGYNALVCAVRGGNENIVYALLMERIVRGSLDRVIDRHTALSLSITNRKPLSIIAMLVEYGADTREEHVETSLLILKNLFQKGKVTEEYYNSVLRITQHDNDFITTLVSPAMAMNMKHVMSDPAYRD